MKAKDICRKIKTEKIYQHETYSKRNTKGILQNTRWKHRNTGRNN